MGGYVFFYSRRNVEESGHKERAVEPMEGHRRRRRGRRHCIWRPSQATSFPAAQRRMVCVVFLSLLLPIWSKLYFSVHQPNLVPFPFVCRFSDAFNYLIFMPEENHIWCGSWDLMGPLLETFYNYFKDDRSDSPLKLLLDRTSREMRQCTQCICQYHQAQELYSTEYDPSSIGPLLEVLRTLDEERISQHLKEINNRIRCGEYDIVHGSGEIVGVMFEVFPFTFLPPSNP